MKTTREAEEQIKRLLALGDLSRAYAEISANRMKKTRDGVVKSRDFLGEIALIFEEVRRSYRKEVLKLLKWRRTRSGEKVTFLAHNGKAVAVLLSSNTGLYGGIVGEVVERFAEEITASPETEVSIVGRLGRSLFISRFPDRPYTYFDFPDNYLDKQALVEIVKHIVQYEQIHIYYGKFVSVVSQKAEVHNIAAETPVSMEKGEDVGPKHKYIFEPTLEEILAFFETQMFTSMFEQTISESQLAKFASRMLAMDRAYQNITHEVDRTKLIKLRISHEQQNRKQLSLMSSMRLWRLL